MGRAYRATTATNWSAYCWIMGISCIIKANSNQLGAIGARWRAGRSPKAEAEAGKHLRSRPTRLRPVKTRTRS